MIISFKDKATADIYNGLNTKEARKLPKELHSVALKKLTYLSYAHLLSDLSLPPSNHLEALKGNYKGFHSIRVNKQWRVVFKWSSLGAENVQIIDYH
ncbi:MAG: type II toxin-antitoxin system RelE/ParE family toxin [Vampirovibrionales bacterium]|nr:type II toxin-antitoxin system RelE/ParE family toxin [Vampirovibrionales bacterium]